MNNIRSLARELVAQVTVHGVSRAALGELNSLAVRSIGTETAYRRVAVQYLRWVRDLRIPLETAHTRGMLIEFLDDYAEHHGQKAVDQARQGLQKIFAVKLPTIEGLIQHIVRDRVYRFEELSRIVRHQSSGNALASLLCFDASLRAHETITVAHRHTGSLSGHRDWSPNRFSGRTDVIVMLVTGKGGLIREVAVSRELWEALMKRERLTQVLVRDREIDYVSTFEVGGGQALSASFSRASKIALGWSHGLHGLRHSFARRRLATLLTLFPPREALLILSQELGHFRVAITLCYLGGR
jgi:integrase